MTQKEIRALLEQRYDRDRWKKLVTGLFSAPKVFARPVNFELERVNERKYVKAIAQLGEVDLADGNTIGLFEVELLPGVADLARNKVAIRRTVDAHVNVTGQAGALICFHDPEKSVWRFSFYSRGYVDDLKLAERTHRKRYTYLLGEGEKCRTAAEQFDVLAKNGGQVTLNDLLEAFSVEKVSKAFFREYKEHYQDFVEHLTGKRMVKEKGKWVEKKVSGPSPKLATYFNGNEKDARDFCKKLMGRLVFLYFLQKKRWLGATATNYKDGEHDFVFKLFSESGGNDGFYPNVLVDLFFDTLNNGDRKDDDYRMPDGTIRKVPFLNGGLFDKDELDRKTERLVFPPELFSNPAKAEDPDERGFLDFLNAYNFTVHEAGPEEQTLAVDPEMLGHIFENLLEDNKDKGAFYTPKEIVHYMCQESLTQYLKNYLTKEVSGTPPTDLEDQLRRFLQYGEWAGLVRYSQPLLKALREVKVCDPAIGSGAFPMGMLHEIFQAVEHIHDLSPDETESIWELKEWEPAEVKLRIIQHSIYGVDIERGAVDIARLRFWLSIIVDEPKPRILPNLDYKIVVGDTLLGKFNGEVLEIDWELKGNTDRVQEMRTTIDALHTKTELFFRDQPKVKKEKLAAEVRALKIDLLSKQLELNRDKFKAHMLSTGRIGDLTKKEMVKATEQKVQLAAYEETLGKLRALTKQKDKPLDYFDWQLDFPEVLNPNVTKDAGFDIVIGNPPYVRQEVIKDMKADLALAFPETFTSVADLFVYFIQLGHEILRKDGVFAYIVSNKWMRAGYGTKLKAYLGEQQLQQLLDFGEQPVFEATAYTCILLTQKTKAPTSHAVLTWSFTDLPLQNLPAFVGLNAYRQPQETFVKADYLIGNAETVAVVATLRSSGVPLGTYLKGGIYYGVKTGYNKAFVITKEKKDELEKQDKRSSTLLKPFLGGRNIERYQTPEPNRWLILIPFGRTKELLGVDVTSEAEAFQAMRKLYPAVMQWLAEHREKCMARDDQGHFWWELRACDYYSEFEKPKVIYSEIAYRGDFLLDTGMNYVDTTIYMMSSADRSLLAYLNSNLFTFVFGAISSSIQGGYYRWKRQYIETMPFIAPHGGMRHQLEAMVDRRLSMKPGPTATALESEIDVLVSKLYGLSWEQAKVVDPGMGLSKEEYDAVELPESEGPSTGAETVTGLTDEGTLFGQPLNELPPPKHSTSRTAESTPSNGKASRAILKFLRANEGWHGKSAVLEGSGVDAAEWNVLIKQLVDEGKVERQGEKKGARYRAHKHTG